MITSKEVNRYISSDLDYNGQLVYIVEYVGDDGENERHTFFDHAEAYAFTRDAILGSGEARPMKGES